jgi:hypothetical protein
LKIVARDSTYGAMPSSNEKQEGPGAKIVAARVLLDSNQAPVEICIYEPVRDKGDKNGDWRCDFSTRRGASPEEIRHAWGVDSLQALIVAIQGLRYVLEPDAGGLSWLGQVGVMGIPLQIADENPHRTAIFRNLIDTEVRREALFWEFFTRSKSGSRG